MITIPAVDDNGVLKPSREFPADAIRVVTDGVDYFIFDADDKIPDDEKLVIDISEKKIPPSTAKIPYDQTKIA